MSPDRFASLLGDVVASKEAKSRKVLQRRLHESLERLNSILPAYQPPIMTVGDEFQGLYATVGEALHASLLLRLLSKEFTDIRFGIGWGRLDVHDPEARPYEQDGPSWWAARAAIEAVSALMDRRSAPKGLRTGFIEWDRSLRARRLFPSPLDDLAWAPDAKGRIEPLPLQQAVNAFLVCRDEIVGRMDARSARLLLARLTGVPITEVAKSEQISPSAIYERLRRSGAYAVASAEGIFGPARTE